MLNHNLPNSNYNGGSSSIFCVSNKPKEERYECYAQKYSGYDRFGGFSCRGPTLKSLDDQKKAWQNIFWALGSHSEQNDHIFDISLKFLKTNAIICRLHGLENESHSSAPDNRSGSRRLGCILQSASRRKLWRNNDRPGLRLGRENRRDSSLPAGTEQPLFRQVPGKGERLIETPG